MPRSLSEKEASVEEGVIKVSNRVPTMRPDRDNDRCSWDFTIRKYVDHR